MESFFISLGIIAPIIVLLCSFISFKSSTLINWEKDIYIFKKIVHPKQILALLLSLIISFVSRWWNIGAFDGLSIIYTLLFALAATFTSNGIYDIKIVGKFADWLMLQIYKLIKWIVKMIGKLIKLIFKKKTPTPPIS